VHSVFGRYAHNKPDGLSRGATPGQPSGAPSSKRTHCCTLAFEGAAAIPQGQSSRTKKRPGRRSDSTKKRFNEGALRNEEAMKSDKSPVGYCVAVPAL